jgi:uncharacterized protein involved in exopolysaccharide biosynthesis
MDFRFYFSLFLRRLHWFLLVAVGISALSIFVARVLPTVYLSNATLVVESEQIPDELAASTVQTQATEQLQIIQQRILSRDTLIEMANRLQIYASDVDGALPRKDADELVNDLRERIKIVTSGGATVRRGNAVQATLVTVSFEAPTAALAATVANDVVTLILKTDVEMRTGTARQTLQFFEQEVARLDKELSESGAAILQFKEANQEALPDSLEFRRTQKAGAEQQLLQLQQIRTELQLRRDRMVRLHNSAGAGQEVTPEQDMTPEQKQLRALRETLASQLIVLSPANPKIKILEAQIAAVEKQVVQQTASGGLDAQGQVMSAYDVQLADIDDQLASLQTQETQIKQSVVTLQASIAATPSNAIALDTLQRSYDNIRSQFDLAVVNKARAETGDTIETLAKGQRISVIEQAVAPLTPERPNRTLIAAGGVGAGLAFGLLVVALIEFLNAGIRRPVELTRKLGITPFATLPYLKTDQETRGKRRWKVLAALAVLAVFALILWGVHVYYLPLDLILDRTLRAISMAPFTTPDLA